LGNCLVQLLILAVMVAGGLCACGWRQSTAPPPPAATPTRAITVLDVVMYDGHYGEDDNNIANPPRWEAPAGGEVILNVENQGMMEHNWAIVKPGVTPPIPYQGGQDDKIILYGAGMVYSDNRTTVTFVAPETPGEYLVMCTVENHYPLMQGRLVVK
jgi:hypothetical protein